MLVTTAGSTNLAACQVVAVDKLSIIFFFEKSRASITLMWFVFRIGS